MANRSVTTGLQFLNAEKHLGERNKYVESEIALWIEAVLNDPIPPKDFDDLLRDGVILCRVINTLKPGSVAKIQKPWTKDAQRANIQAFLEAARAYGVPEDKLFSVEDLHEKTGVPNVIKTMIFLGRAIYDHTEWQGPYLGPRPTGEIKDWSEEKLRAGEGIVPLQAGTNKFASQKGIRIGRARDIMFANTCVEDKDGLGEWHEPENKENGEGDEAVAAQEYLVVGASFSKHHVLLEYWVASLDYRTA